MAMQLARHTQPSQLAHRNKSFFGPGQRPGLSKRDVVLPGKILPNVARDQARLQFAAPTRHTACDVGRTTRFVARAQSVEIEPSDPFNESTTAPWQDWIAFATSLYPVYMILGGLIAFWRPSAFTWFVKRGPDSYSAALGIIMLAMGFTLHIKDLLHVLTERPVAVMFGFAAQYTIMPFLGAALSRALGLPAELSAGLILMACCPGGTASNVVTYIARGDVPLSILMTICTTFAAVFTTPLLTSLLAGAYVPVDAASMALSTLQVVLAPVIAGACLQTFFPQIVAVITHVAPLIAVLVSSLLASSVFSANVPLLLKTGSSSMASVTSSPPVAMNLARVVCGVLALHGAGFLLGYIVSRVAGFKEPQRRAISIEVGMQNSSLGVVLATTHFASPLTAVPAAISAMLMNIMGSGLAVLWRNAGSSLATSDDIQASGSPLPQDHQDHQQDIHSIQSNLDIQSSSTSEK